MSAIYTLEEAKASARRTDNLRDTERSALSRLRRGAAEAQAIRDGGEGDAAWALTTAENAAKADPLLARRFEAAHRANLEAEAAEEAATKEARAEALVIQGRINSREEAILGLVKQMQQHFSENTADGATLGAYRRVSITPPGPAPIIGFGEIRLGRGEPQIFRRSG